MNNIIQEEPVRFWAAITGIVSSIIALLQIFGAVNWTGDQIAAIMLVVAAVGTMFQFFFVRNQVTPSN